MLRIRILHSQVGHISCSKEGGETALVASLCQTTAPRPARGAHSCTLWLSGKGSCPACSHPAQHFLSGHWHYGERKLCDLVSQGHGHLFPLTQGRVRGCSLPTVKAGGCHSTGVVCVAWHDTRMQHYVCASKEIQGAAETSCVKTYDCLNMRTKCFDYMSNTRHLNQIQANQKQTKKNQTNKLRQTDHANHIYSPDCLLQFLRIQRDFKKGQLRLLGTAHRINMHLIKYKRHQ